MERDATKSCSHEEKELDKGSTIIKKDFKWICSDKKNK